LAISLFELALELALEFVLEFALEFALELAFEFALEFALEFGFELALNPGLQTIEKGSAGMSATKLIHLVPLKKGTNRNSPKCSSSK
jgi:hypothetical protein